MMTIQKICGLSLLLTAVSLSGCSSLKDKGGAQAPDSGTTSPSAVARDQAGIGQADPRSGLVAEADAADAAAAAKAKAKAARAGIAGGQAVVHFEFDSAALSDADRDLLKQQATYLKANPKVKARLEGHTDARGTQEYNMALGERRAKAASVFLQAQGIAASRLEVISYGETKPVASGEDDEAWAQNRRVEVSYR